MVQMLAVDIRDHGDRGRQPHERAVRLVRLDDHPFPVSETRIGTVSLYDAAVDHRRSKPGSVQHRADERCGCRLAVRPCHRDIALEAHELGQHFRPFYDRHPFGTRCMYLGITLGNRGRDDNRACFTEIGRIVADRHWNPEGLQIRDLRAGT